MQILIVAHAGLAQAYRHIVETLFASGDIPLSCIDVSWENKPADISARLDAFLREHAEPTLILTDLFGSSHANACLPYLKKGKIEMVTGFNLAMLTKAVQMSTSSPDLATFSEWIVTYGREHLYAVPRKKQG